MKFELIKEQNKRISNWLKDEIYPEIIAKQKQDIENPDVFQQSCWDDGYPWQGAIGGGLTYCFTPTSIGVIEVVQYGEHKLDVTQYDLW